MKNSAQNVSAWRSFAHTVGSFFAQLAQYALLMRVDKPIGFLLLLWPILWALWIAGDGHPDQKVFTVFVLGAFLMRSAGCVINDFADRNFDPYVERTKDRPLATGRVRPEEALFLFAGLALISLGLVLTMNRLTVIMAVVGGALAMTYPFMKRYTSLPQFYLGAAFGWGVPMAFAAQMGELPRLAWLMFIAAILWAVVYDTIYAMVDREDDRRLGLKSTAILFADADRFIVGVIQLMLLLCLYLIGQSAKLGFWYGVGLVAAACLCLYQQFLIRDRERAKCYRAFKNNNYFGAVIFVGILLEYTFAGQ